MTLYSYVPSPITTEENFNIFTEIVLGLGDAIEDADLDGAICLPSSTMLFEPMGLYFDGGYSVRRHSFNIE